MYIHIDFFLATDPHTAIFPTQHHSGVYGQLRTCHLLKKLATKEFHHFCSGENTRFLSSHEALSVHDKAEMLTFANHLAILLCDNME